MNESFSPRFRAGLGLPMVLFLIFLVLRLTGTVDWAWYWVAFPLFISWGISLLIVVIFFGMVTMAREREGNGR